MDDEKLKELIHKNVNISKAPADEWENIERNIHSDRIKLKIFIPSIVSACLVIAVSVFSYQQFNIHQDVKLAEYLIDSGDYFSGDESDEFYL